MAGDLDYDDDNDYVSDDLLTSNKIIKNPIRYPLPQIMPASPATKKTTEESFQWKDEPPWFQYVGGPAGRHRHTAPFLFLIVFKR
jgi:hypothetical protein